MERNDYYPPIGRETAIKVFDPLQLPEVLTELTRYVKLGMEYEKKFKDSNNNEYDIDNLEHTLEVTIEFIKSKGLQDEYNKYCDENM